MHAHSHHLGHQPPAESTVWIGEVVAPGAMLCRARAEPWTPYLPADAGVAAAVTSERGPQTRGTGAGRCSVDIPVKAFSESDFVDAYHFSAEGSLKFATLMAPKIAEIRRKEG